MPVLNMKLKSFKKVMGSDKPYIVKFTDPSCHLCVSLKPVFHKIAKEMDNKFVFGNVNITENPDLAEMFVDDGVPTIYVIKKDELFEVPYPTDSGYSYDYLTNYLINLGY